MKTLFQTMLHVIMIAWLGSASAAALLFDPAEWVVPRRAEALTRNTALAELVRELEAKPKRQLRIRHPGGEAGSTEAEALRAALIALGLPGAQIRLEPGATENNRLLLEMVERP